MSGKHLAVALAVRAIENGFSVAFHRLEDLLAALKRDADVSPQRLRQRKHMNVALLVIDEVGFEPMTRRPHARVRVVRFRGKRRGLWSQGGVRRASGEVERGEVPWGVPARCARARTVRRSTRCWQAGQASGALVGRFALSKGAVGRHKAHIGVALTAAAQRRRELEVDHGDDLLGQVRALTRDLLAMLEEAKRANSGSAYLQITDRLQKQIMLQAQLLERAEVVGPRRYAIRWLEPAACPHHPDGDCPLRSNGPVESPPDGSNGGGAANTTH